jgi:hypothetical protein
LAGLFPVLSVFDGVKRRAPRSTVPTWSLFEFRACGLELALFDLLRQLDSANGDGCVVESFEPEHRPNPLFDSAVVLFDEMVRVLARSDSHSFGEFARFLHFPHRAMRCGIGVQRYLRRFARFFIALRRKAFAAFTPRFALRKKSTVRPPLSTAQYR